ncbi:hypothetical protein D5018_15230 [Parashewanella curva]|uniref:Uncharacterized protein n=1 Tax=Parashewanella curva TaxID=2338552 RepID=A0A3L8PW64_9GAMM|nr:hypothetical protein D5018_15230 [Parashewanella curva]
MSSVGVSAEVTKTQPKASEPAQETKRCSKLCGYEIKQPKYLYTGIALGIGSAVYCFFAMYLVVCLLAWRQPVFLVLPVKPQLMSLLQLSKQCITFTIIRYLNCKI